MSTSSTTALAGLSGYDFSSIIDMMVTSYRQPETNLQSQQTTLKTQQSAWQDAKTRLSALENTLAALKNSDTWTTTKATSSSTDLLNVTGGTSGVTGTYNIKVDALAQTQTIVTGVFSSDKTFTFNNGDTLFSIKTSAGDSVAIKATADKAYTLTDIQNLINAQSSQTHVKASLIQVADGKYRLSLTSTATGTSNVPVFVDNSYTGSDNNGFLKALGFTLGTDGKVSNTYDPSLSDSTSPSYDPTHDPTSPSYNPAADGGITVQATDAKIEVNGVTITNSSNTITTAIQGVTLNLSEANPSQTVRVTVDSDSSAATAAVQSFINQYNSLMSFIDDKTNYDATTETAGTLYADPTLRGIQSTLRTLMGGFWQVAGGDREVLSDIGISTSADNYGESAALTFDTDKFQKALENNPQMVVNLFGAPSNGVDPSDAQYSKASGIANVLDNYLQPMVKFQGTLDQTNDSYTQQIKDLQNQINDFEERASAYEDRIKLQFANLETSLTALNQQSSSFTSLLNSLNSQTSSSK